MTTTPSSYRVIAALAVALCGCFASLALDLPFVIMAFFILLPLLVIAVDRTITGLFLVAICAHVFLSYAGVTIEGPSGVPPDNNVQAFVLLAFKVFVVGISATLIGYAITKPKVLDWAIPTFDLNRLQRSAVITAFIGGAIILYVVARVGFLQMVLEGNFVRFFGEDEAGSSFALYHSLIRRGLAISGAAAPILLLRWQETRSRKLLLIACACLITMAITTRRGYLAVSLLTFMLTSGLLFKNRKAIIIFVVVISIVFLALQSVFALVPTESSNPIIWTATLVSTLMTDVNDFAWTLSEWNNKLYYGATWLAALWPLPATVSDFKDRNLLSSVTKDVVGIPRDAQHGGLRILIYGEAYLNGGYPGVVLVGLLFGFLVRRMGSILEWAKTGGPWVLLPCMFVFVLACCQFYFSGSAVLADAILTVITFGFVYLVSMKRLVPQPGLA